MNYLIARVSDPDQRKALPAQSKKLFDYADRLDWKEGQDFTYIEFDETAFKENRVKFQDVVIDPLLKATGLTICVFDKIDRFSRDSSSEEKSIFMNLLKKGAIEMHFPSDNLFMRHDSPAADKFRLDIGVSLASYYSAAIRDNVKRRFDQMLRDGVWISRAPIGYMNYQEIDANGKIFKGIKLDPERDHLVRKGFELRSTGLPYRSIAKELKTAGLRSRTEKALVITGTQWEQILNNPFYIGTMVSNGKEYEHKYPRLIEQWLWDSVQDVKNKRTNGHTKYNSKPYLLKKLKCHECGYSITFDGPKHNGETYGKCTEYSGKHGAKWVNETILYDQIRNLLASIQLPKKLLPKLIEEIESNHISEQAHYLSNRTRLEKEYNKLDEEVKDLFKDRKQFKSRPDIFEKMVKDIEKQQKSIMDDLQDHSSGDKAFVIGAAYLLDICSRAVELFDAESTKLEQKRFLLDFILSNATLDGEKLHLTLKEPFEAVIAIQKTGKWCPRQDSNLRP
jgi:site-specific DNA recombinase